MSQGRHSASAAILNGLIDVVGGINFSSEQNFVEAYDPKKNDWVVKLTHTTATIVRPPVVAFNGFLHDFSKNRAIKVYDPEIITSIEVRMNELQSFEEFIHLFSNRSAQISIIMFEV